MLIVINMGFGNNQDGLKVLEVVSIHFKISKIIDKGLFTRKWRS